MRRTRTATIGAAITLGLLLLPLYGLKIWNKEGYSDFDVYYRAGADAAQGRWGSVYSFSSGWDTPFRYGPPSLAFFAPLSGLSHHISREVWFVLQFLLFAASFQVLRKSVRRIVHSGSLLDADWIVALALLLTLRFIIDDLTVGQISSLMLLGWVLGLENWLKSREAQTGAGMFVPTVIKIAPGLHYPMAFLLEGKSALRSWASAFCLLLGSALLTWAWVGSAQGAFALWQDWIRVVAADSTYFDSSHYGTQSLNSTLLRLANSGWIPRSLVSPLHLAAGIIVIGSTAWVTRLLAHARATRPDLVQASRAHVTSLVILAYLLLMPETFKYSLPFLAIPLIVLLARPRGRLQNSSLVLVALTLSLAGLDLIGARAFFALQKASVPALTLFVLWMAALHQAHQEARSS